MVSKSYVPRNLVWTTVLYLGLSGKERKFHVVCIQTLAIPCLHDIRVLLVDYFILLSKVVERAKFQIPYIQGERYLFGWLVFKLNLYPSIRNFTKHSVLFEAPNSFPLNEPGT
jgi:hypothetical protein